MNTANRSPRVALHGPPWDILLRRGSGVLGVAAAALSLVVLSSCSSLDSRLNDAASGSPGARRAALTDLEAEIRELRGPNASRADRATVNAFLSDRFARERDTGDAVTRAKILSLALQGEFDCREELLAAGARDDAWVVRQTAVQGMLEVQPNDLREVLTDLLLHDSELVVRLEAAKAFRVVGSRDWAEPLVRIVVDTNEDYSLRYQAYRSAVKLTGEDLPFAEVKWRAWLQRSE